MRLHSRFLGGAGTPIVILHGLFGSSRNWATAGRFLTACGAVTALDLRNHGESPHDASHTVDDMAADVREWLAENAAGQPAVIVGHSMGGQAAMALVLAHPASVAALVVVDVAPRPYPDNHAAELAALSVDVSRLGSRAEVDAAMAAHVGDPGVRQFLQTNLERSGDGFRWRLNVEALRHARAPTEFRGRYGGPALFVAAGRSGYLTAADHGRIRGLFPAASIRVIEQADHWVHVSSPDAFRAEVEAFLTEIGRRPGRAGEGMRG